MSGCRLTGSLVLLWLLATGGLDIARVNAQVTATGGDASQVVQVIPATETLLEDAAQGGSMIRLLLSTVSPTIGTPYEWGGSDLAEGVDCSNYTWQLFRKAGLGYDRYLDTHALSKVKESPELRQIAYKEATPGDLLVYGYYDETNQWHGHVVILVDKEGQRTGHRGLVLGAHGPPVNGVQFITYTGFEEGFYKSPEKQLRNVLRVKQPQAADEPD